MSDRDQLAAARVLLDDLRRQGEEWDGPAVAVLLERIGPGKWTTSPVDVEATDLRDVVIDGHVDLQALVAALIAAGWQPPRPTPEACDATTYGHEFDEVCVRCGVDAHSWVNRDAETTPAPAGEG